jgi:hypothetical protein
MVGIPNFSKKQVILNEETIEIETNNNWNQENTKIILFWITVGSYSIEALEECITLCRKRIRLNNFISLGFSTASGSLSITNYNKNDYTVSMIISILMTILSFGIAIAGGFVKIYQFQERLELYVKTKQEWIAFVSDLSSILESTKSERRNALEILKEYTPKYNNLLSVDYEVFPEIKKKYNIDHSNATKIQISPDDELIIKKQEGFRIYNVILTLVRKHAALLKNEN